MGIGIGLIKYIFFTFLSGGGFVCMYLFGGTIVTLFSTLTSLFSGKFVEAFVEYFINSALPPTSIEHIIGQAFIGVLVAGASWFLAMAARGVAL